MYSQSYDGEAPIPLVAHYTVVKEDEDAKTEAEERVILEIGRPDEKPKDELTFSHKKYDKTISHHRSYVLEDYAEPRRIIFRPHEIDSQDVPRLYHQEYREAGQLDNSESSLDYAQEVQESHTKLVIDEVHGEGGMSWKDRALQLEKGMFLLCM